MKKLLLIDGYGFLFRAYFAIKENSMRSDGLSVGGVFGFTNMILNLLEIVPYSHVAMVFDTGSKTFRHLMYPEYKSNRSTCPEDLKPQFPLVRDFADAINIVKLERVGYEADDIIATLAKKGEKEGFEVVIASSDKDLMQLVNDNICMYDYKKRKKLNQFDVFEKWGVSPDKVIDVMALAGDTSDNIPGVYGIGPKIAAELINTYGSLEGLYNNIGDIKQEKRRQKLEENKDNAFLSKKLVSLDESIEGFEINDLVYQKREEDKLLDFLQEMEFHTIINKIKNSLF